jgi:hypothetical protein
MEEAYRAISEELLLSVTFQQQKSYYHGNIETKEDSLNKNQ